MLDARGRLYFAATDTLKSQLSATGVESAWLRDQLEECRARQKVWILDCCYSGSFDRTKGDTDMELERRLGGNGRGFAVLTASRAEEYSYEGTPLPGTSGRSVFTAGLVDGLRSGDADRDGDGYITVEDAYTYAADQVTTRGGAQSPQRWLYGAEGEIVLARNPRGATPAALPEALQLSLDNPYPDIRQAAVATLGTWLTSSDSGRVRAAKQALQRVASHDSPTVAAAARALLHQTNPPTPPGSGRASDHSPTHSDRFDLLLDYPSVVGDQHSVLAAQLVQHPAADLLALRVGVPTCLVQQPRWNRAHREFQTPEQTIKPGARSAHGCPRCPDAVSSSVGAKSEAVILGPLPLTASFCGSCWSRTVLRRGNVSFWIQEGGYADRESSGAGAASGQDDSG